MEKEPGSARPPRRGWPWGLLAGTVLVAGLGGGLAARSISALLARNAQLEREANESEARVADLQILRASMERRLRALERQQPAPQRAPSARALREADAQLAGREAARKMLELRLKDELRRGDARLEESEAGLRVDFSEKLLFEPGRATLTQQGTELLARLGPVLVPLTDHSLRIEARTDEIPAPGAVLAPAGPVTGWELSAARAVAVVRFLTESTRLPPERLSALGQATFRPEAPARTQAPRPRTGHVELLVQPLPSLAEPVSARAPAPPQRASASAPRLARER